MPSSYCSARVSAYIVDQSGDAVFGGRATWRPYVG